MATATGGNVENGNSPATNWNSEGTKAPLVALATTRSKMGHNWTPKGVSKVGKYDDIN